MLAKCFTQFFAMWISARCPPSKMEVRTFCNEVPEVTFHHLSYSLLTTDLANSQEKGLDESVNTKRQGLLESILGFATCIHPICLVLFQFRSFVIAIPPVWNVLPLDNHMTGSFSSFKYRLKCHYLRDVIFIKFHNILFTCAVSP